MNVEFRPHEDMIRHVELHADPTMDLEVIRASEVLRKILIEERIAGRTALIEFQIRAADSAFDLEAGPL